MTPAIVLHPLNMSESCPETPLWQPSAFQIENGNLTRYVRWLASHGYYRPMSGPAELYRWSIKNPAEFWSSIAVYFDVHFFTSADMVLTSGSALEARWFPGATLNYAEHLLRGGKDCPEKLAVIALAEPGDSRGRRTYTFAQLEREVARVAAWLRSIGVGKGDRVAGLMPNSPETVIACLASASLGAIWSSCPPELSPKGIIDRWSQIEPVVLFFVSGYRYGGKFYDRREAVMQVIEGLPSVRAAVQVEEESLFLLATTGSVRFFQWTQLGTRNSGPATRDSQPGTRDPGPDTLQFEPVGFGHPLWILYSSGTTGIPKPIVHGHGGMLLEHLKTLSLHLDLKADDRFFWYTTAGWMMWNFLISGLGLAATIVLYDGSPKYPDLGVLWRLIEQEKLTYFGTSAPFLAVCEKAGLEPGFVANLTSLRSIGSTGAPLSPEGFRWVYRSVKSDLWLGSASGGTDVCTAFVLSHPWLPVYAGKLQCRGLGAPIEAWDAEGKPVWDEVGELVLTGSMPCMPVGFWNDPDRERFRAAYFEHYPGIWRHGDWIEICAGDGQCIIYGRSDSTLNRGGIRMGTSEFYRVIEAIPEVLEALVIDTTSLGAVGQHGRLLLFVVLREGESLRQALREQICSTVKAALSPRYVPDEVYAVPEIPHTLNGKKLEVPVKRIFQGIEPAKAVAREAMSNPDALKPFLELAKSSR